jgi:hypothetical protein
VLHAESTCDASENHEKAIPKSDETLIQEFAQDEQGNLVLNLR